jgi:glycosyltransferase involved in cell wall biosynthesis
VSERIKTSLLKQFGNRIAVPTVIPIHVSSVLPPKVALPPRPFTFTLITVSRLEPEKRIVDILQALATIHALYPSVGLVVVGEGSERKRLVRMAQHLGIAENVLFLGERPDAVGLMQSAEAYIQASAYEGYGRTLIEAALSGIPIITTDVGVVGELLRGYQEVLVAPVSDPAALAVHIVGLVSDSASRIELSLNARTTVQEYLATHTTTAKDIARDLARLV